MSDRGEINYSIIKNNNLSHEDIDYKNVLGEILELINKLRESKNPSEKFDLISKGIASCGWRRVHFYVYDTKNNRFESCASYGLSQSDLEYLSKSGLNPDDIRVLLSGNFDEYKIGRSYYLPAECDDPLVVRWRETAIASKVSDEGPGRWNPEDILLFPLIGFGKKLVGIISVDEPINGRKPTAESLKIVELFIDYAIKTIDESDFERYFNKTKNLVSQIFDLTPAIIFVLDANRKIIDANRFALNTLKYEKEDLIGEDESKIFASKMDYENLNSARSDSQFVGEFLFNKKNGDQIWGHLSSISVVDADGKIDGYLTMIMDITENKQLTQYLIRAEKLAGIGILAGGIAHEINNPLYAILGLAESIANRKKIDKEAREDAMEIIEYTKDVSKIVKDLSGYAFSAHRDSVSSVNLNEIISKTVQMVERTSDTTGIKFVLDLNEIPEINGSNGELTQVFANLITNAVDATKKRGGQITISTRKIGQDVECKVSDTGEGIPPEYMQHIYEPFYTTKELGKGTGLGLYVCYRIITKHRGSIDVESEVGRGTTFIVSFPIPMKDDRRQRK